MRQITKALDEIQTRWLSIAILSLATLIYFASVRRVSLLQWDDAYITFRFAQHFAQGQGLIWNIGGERVEGFTSFLHVLLLAIPIKFAVAPEVGGLALGIGSVLLTAGMIGFMIRRQFGRLVPAAAIVLGLYLVDQATAIHSTSGLETQLFVVMLCAAFLTAWFFIETPRWQTALGLALLVFLSVLARPEGVLYGAAMYGTLAVYALYLLRHTQQRACLGYVGLSATVLVLLGAMYAVWKYNYFGYLLPNPFYVKSNQLALKGIEPVWVFVRHTVIWYTPLAAGFILLGGRRIIPVLENVKTWMKIGLTLITPLPALIYYLTITHEVGGAYRFTYPIYFYGVMATAACASVATRAIQTKPRVLAGLSLITVAYLFVPIVVQQSWRISPLPRDPFMQYHWNIALALKETGLGPKATVLTDAAGVIPYVSEFNQVDRVGLVDNFLSGRQKIALQEREQYIWNRPLDVYIGGEPPAFAGAQQPEDDPRLRTRYVTHLLTRELTFIEDRIFVQDPALLHARMRELRDRWIWVGEVEWAGFDAWGLKSFLYVRKDSPYVQVLQTTLSKIVARKPEQVTFD